MICNCIVEHVTPLPLKKSDTENFSRKLVIDYSSCPIQFTCPMGSLEFDRQPVFLTDLPPMGEADVKFLRWAHVFQGDIVSYSVDGDFIPISLIHYERQLLEKKDRRHQPFRIALYRLKYKMPSSSSSEPGGSKKKAAAAAGGEKQLLLTGKKRKSDGSMVLSQTQQALSPEDASKSSSSSSRGKREYEYVDIPSLYYGLRNVFDQRVHRCDEQGDEKIFFMRVLAVLVGLGGTDFSRYRICIHFYFHIFEVFGSQLCMCVFMCAEIFPTWDP